MSDKPTINPFLRKNELEKHAHAGATLIEQERAIAEIQVRLVAARSKPRNQAEAFEKIMDSCSRLSFAETALYSFNRGGAVTGPSIRMAEEMARCWGNIAFGTKELSRKPGASEMMVYAWDLETNAVSDMVFTVEHIRDRSEEKGGSIEVTTQRDIYELTANQASRRLRTRILALLPDDLVSAAQAKVRETMKAGITKENIGDTVKTLILAFKEFNIGVTHLEQFIGRPLGDALPDDVVTLRAAWRQLKNKEATASQIFRPVSDTNILDEEPAPPPPVKRIAEVQAAAENVAMETGADKPAATETEKRGRGRPKAKAEEAPPLAPVVAAAPPPPPPAPPAKEPEAPKTPAPKLDIFAD